jgi:hypothetical protein
MFQLHRMDEDREHAGNDSDYQAHLAPEESPVVLEERRRSFWALYMLESYAITRTGLPSDLGSAKVPYIFRTSLLLQVAV